MADPASDTRTPPAHNPSPPIPSDSLIYTSVSGVKWSSIWVIFAPLLLATVALAYAPLLSGFQRDSEQHSGKTSGVIVVDSPEIYTRERLVNDRFQQDSWLTRQLKDTDDLFKDVRTQAFTSSIKRTSVASEINTTIAPPTIPPQLEINGKTGGLQLPDAKNIPSKIETHITSQDIPKQRVVDDFNDKLDYRDRVRNEILENQLDDRHDIFGNTLIRLKFDAAVIPDWDTTAWGIVLVKLSADRKNKGRISPDSTEAERNAYHQWLNRLQEVLYGIIGELTTAFFNTPPAFTDPKFLDVYKASMSILDRLEHEDLIRSRHLGSEAYYITLFKEYLISTVARNYDSFKRLQNSNGTEPNTATSKDGIRDKGARSLAEIFLPAKVKRIEIESFCDAEKIDSTVIDDIAIFPTEPGAPALSRRQMIIYFENFLQEGMQHRVPEVVPLDTCLPAFDAPLPIKQAVTLLAYRISEILKDREPAALGAGNPTILINKLLAEVFYHEIKDKNLHEYADFKIEHCEIGLCRLNVSSGSEEGTKFEKFTRALEPKEFVYSYAVTPKESVNRIRRTASQNDSISFAAKMAGELSNLRSESALKLASEMLGEIRAVDAAPLIIGFGDASPIFSMDNSESGGSASGKESIIGWMIGPQSHSMSRANSSRPRHRPQQLALTAVISVPGWWKFATLDVVTCWITQKEIEQDPKFTTYEKCKSRLKSGSSVGGDCTIVSAERKCFRERQSGNAPHEKLTYPVRLPGDPDSISRAFDFQQPRTPYVRNEPSFPTLGLVQIGQPANLVLRGGRLWRSSVVVFGTQIADEIVVLPNMNGIVAKFRCVETPTLFQMERPPSRGALVPVSVWTSEGESRPQFARIMDWEANLYRLKGVPACNEKGEPWAWAKSSELHQPNPTGSVK